VLHADQPSGTRAFSFTYDFGSLVKRISQLHSRELTFRRQNITDAYRSSCCTRHVHNRLPQLHHHRSVLLVFINMTARFSLKHLCIYVVVYSLCVCCAHAVRGKTVVKRGRHSSRSSKSLLDSQDSCSLPLTFSTRR
jgi:hypothetical protein